MTVHFEKISYLQETDVCTMTTADNTKSLFGE